MLMTGFEAGMLGYALFSPVYGAGNIFRFGVIDLGQVVFVFSILAPLLERVSAGARPFGQTVRNFFQTPVSLSILLGIFANQDGLLPRLSAWLVTARGSSLRTPIRKPDSKAGSKTTLGQFAGTAAIIAGLLVLDSALDVPSGALERAGLLSIQPSAVTLRGMACSRPWTEWR